MFTGVSEPIPECRWKIRRDSSWFVIMFVADICLFYLIPLLLSVVLYSLIAKVMLSKERNKSLNAAAGGSCATGLTAYRSRPAGAAAAAAASASRRVTGTNSAAATAAVANRDQSRVQVSDKELMFFFICTVW